MSDEQTIYISPDDDLTTVRERLENIQTRKVTLVIPAQTQLRSHVAWKLLYARLRELNKEVLIVSSDPQVRSVAHAVKFTVAHSLESSQKEHSRPVGRPTRSGPPARTKSTNQTQRSTPARSAPRSTNNLRTKSPEERSWHEDESELSPPSRQRERTGYQGPKLHQDDIIDDLDPATFQGPEKKYGQNFDYRVNAPSPIQPLTPDQIEEPDLLLEDYTQAQDIRSAANKLAGQLDPISDTPRIAPEVSQTPSSHLPIDADEEDPFSYMEDKQFSQSREQHGNTPINDDDDGYEHVIRDVSDTPTSIISEHFEYDMPPAIKKARKKKSPETIEGVKKRDTTRQQPRLSGNIAPTPPPVQSLPPAPARRIRPEDLDDDDLLPVEERPIADRPTRIQTRDRLNEVRPPRSMREREPEPVPLARTGPRKPGSYSGQLNRPAAPPQSPQRPGASHSTGVLRPQQPAAASRSAAPSTGARQRNAAPPVTRQPRTKRNNTPIVIIAVIAICLIVAIAVGIYLIPTATATITVATSNYSHAISLTANTSGTAGTVPAQQIEQVFSKQGTETATGSKLVGTATAMGDACFNNNATTADITIPNGSIIAAANGVQFATIGEAIIPHQTTCTNGPQIQVHAVQSGQSGNVPVGTITVIPNLSLDAIAKYNDTTAAQLKITVNNPTATTGGGVKPVPAVTEQDLSKAKTDLHKQLQGQIDTWKTGLQKDGVLGTLVTTDTLVGTPQVGSTINSGKTFSTGLQVKATILLVKNADIQNAAISQLSAAIKTDKVLAGDIILTPQTVTITKLKQQATNNTSMKLDFTATAKATGKYDANTLKNSIASQSKNAAQDTLHNQNPGVQDAKITVTPDFIPWVPWDKDHITVNVIPGTTTTNK